MNEPLLIVIVGPTAAGKTEVAASIAAQLKTDVISADSRQIYRELSIGTAVPSIETLNRVTHHMIQCKSIHDYYNAYQFELEVLCLLDGLFLKHQCVVMAGGSGMYVDAVCNGIDDLPTVDPELRKMLTDKYHSEGIVYLQNQLKCLDPDYFRVVDIHNYKRVMKAVEVCMMTGKTYSGLITGKKKKRAFKIVSIGITDDREVLYRRIEDRVDEMMNNGLENEARMVFPFKGLNALNTVGYKELFDYFEKKISLDEAISLIKRDTRRYAKRQMTWFNRNKDTKWFKHDQTNEIIQYITQFMS